MESFALPLTFVVSFLSSFIGTNVGGGGLILVPTLIFLGLPPQVAIGTSRIGALASVSTGIFQFHQEGKVDYRIGFPLMFFSIAGSYIGSNTLLTIPTELLEKLLGLCIILILIVVLFQKNYGVHVTRDKSPYRKTLGYFLFFFIGFWGAFFGGGSAIFGNIVLTSCFGLTFLECAGTRKVAALGMGVTAAIVYILAGVIDWTFALVLLAGGMLGGFVGARHGLRKGDAWVRKLFIAVVLFSALELLL